MSRTEDSQEQADGRLRPLVWVKKIVLYKSIDPVDEIRQINFTTGLNIIQGESNESEESFQSGHGIGKTTVCRLLRYCLGESSYGQKHVIEEIKHCFPNGYVGAVIQLAGTDWAVLRPLGNRIKEFAADNGPLDALPQGKSTKHYADFFERLATLVLTDVPVKESLTSGQHLQWPHVLAMCSRDQESRYDRFWNWRHTRSESGTPIFRKPKVDAGLCVRAILGLLDPEEPKLRTKLEQLEAVLEQTQDEIKKKRDEPNFHITRLRTSLANDCGVQDAANAALDEQSLVGLPAVARMRLAALDQEIAQIEEQLAPLDRQINLAAASLLEPTELAEQRQAASKVTVEGNDTLLADIERLRIARQGIRDAESALCRYGGVLIGQCSYVQARAVGIDGELRERQRTTLPTVTEREQIAARLTEQAGRQQSIIRQIQDRLDELNRQKNDLVERRRTLNDQLRRIPLTLSELQDWNSMLEGTKPNTAIQSLGEDLANTESAIGTAKAKLADLITAQVVRAKLLQSRFDGVVGRTLTKDFKGVVDVEEEGIDFRIKRGESLSGEAYETLAILLADLALLFESDAPHSHHPGLLIHDSPREADLNLRIYQRFLDVADEHMREAGQHGGIPYQYIVTTTTLPSKGLQKKSVTKLELSGGAGSLFGRQLETVHAAPAPPTLFDTTEAQ